MSEETVSCHPSDADWYVEITHGYTFCPCVGRCRMRFRSYHEREYGTETDYSDGYFKGRKPTRQDVAFMVPEGSYILEVNVRSCTPHGK